MTRSNRKAAVTWTSRSRRRSSSSSRRIGPERKLYPATVIGYGKTADVALIRLQGATGLHTVPIGNSAAAKTGDGTGGLGGYILAQFKPGDTTSVTWVSPAGQQTTSTMHLTAGPPH
jgi:S1-C subfamily serine protease